jgi:hypothetical protein
MSPAVNAPSSRARLIVFESGYLMHDPTSASRFKGHNIHVLWQRRGKDLQRSLESGAQAD